MEEKNENVEVEETQSQEQNEENPQVDESKFKSAGDDSVLKVYLSKPPKPVEENETKKDNTNDEGVIAESENADTSQEQKEVQPEAETQEAPVLEEITEEKIEEKTEEVAVATEEAIKESIETGKPLPENIKKLVDFMEETGGDLNDYVKLNQDYSKLDNQDVLYQYY